MMLVLKGSSARAMPQKSKRARPTPPGSFLVGMCPTSPAHKARGPQLRTYDWVGFEPTFSTFLDIYGWWEAHSAENSRAKNDNGRGGSVIQHSQPRPSPLDNFGHDVKILPIFDRSFLLDKRKHLEIKA